MKPYRNGHGVCNFLLIWINCPKVWVTVAFVLCYMYTPVKQSLIMRRPVEYICIYLDCCMSTMEVKGLVKVTVVSLC